ncbi:plasmid transfer protein TraB [Streptomyces virginiae]|uniref:plasmid transfer protein TraB n=2 Tax=Streptomyces virginiae TaxID=1961 RepID=UPI0036A191DA
MGSDIEKVNQAAEARLNGESSAGGVKGWLFHRAKPFLPPWVVAGGVGVASVPAALAWQGAPFAGIGLTLASGGLTAAAWFAAKPTGRQRRLHSAVTVAAASSWFTCASVAGPWSGPLPDLYFMGGAALAISWNIRQVLRWNPDTAPSADASGLMEKIGLAKALIHGTKVEPNRVTARVELEAGTQTNAHMTAALTNVASALDLPTTAVRYLPDPDSARRGELVIVPEDMLSDVIEWQGPSLPGGSIADPLVIGRYDDGSPLMLWLPGDPDTGRNATHLLISGMTGSGKGDGALNVLTEIMSRKDVVVFLSDPKAFQDFRPLLPGITWAVEGGAPTEAMVQAIQAAIPARTRWLGAHSYRQWVPQAAEQQNDPVHSCQPDRACGCEGMPFLVGWMEEAANTLRYMGEDAFNGIAQEARAAGVSFVISLQRASYDQVSTTTRASIPSVLCFGVNGAGEAGFAMPDEVLAAGADPGVWKNRKPGYCYLCSTGIPDDRLPTPARTWRFTIRSISLMEAVAQWAARHGARPGLITDQAVTATVGRAYTERDQHTTDQPTPEEDDVTGEPLVDEEDTQIDPERDLDGSEAGDDIPIFGDSTGRKPGPEEARQLFAHALAEFEAAGQMVVGPKDFLDWCERHQLSRPWVSERLKEAAIEGRLEPTAKAGRWRIVPQLVDA